MRYSLALADLNNDSSVSLHKIAWIYDLSWSTLQACWKERQSAKVFQTGQQQLSVQEKNALIWWIDTMTAWEWPSQIEQLKFMTKHLMTVKGDLNPLEQHWYKNFLHRHSDFKTQYSRNLNQDQRMLNLETIQNGLIYTTSPEFSMVFWSQTYTTWMKRDLQWASQTASKF
jgi:hypothetical protein